MAEQKVSFYERVYEKMREIPKGRVSTYGEIARALGSHAYKVVGNACRNNPYAPEVPCHRVVNSNGFIGGFGGEQRGANILRKIELLRKEGVEMDGLMIADFKKILFKFR
jgi:methylated-DNA-[protein]-cysteine S-methyltransferase